MPGLIDAAGIIRACRDQLYAERYAALVAARESGGDEMIGHRLHALECLRLSDLLPKTYDTHEMLLRRMAGLPMREQSPWPREVNSMPDSL